MRTARLRWACAAMAAAPMMAPLVAFADNGFPGGQHVSLSSFFNRVGLRTTANGGLLAQVTNRRNAGVVLSEQVCHDRSAAI